MISKLADYKKQIIIFGLWFPILFSINANLTDILYFGSGVSANINAIRIILFLFSFIFLIFIFIKNFKKIKLINSIFFIYLIIFIIQSNFLFSENFSQLMSNYKIFLSGDMPYIMNFISDIKIGLEIQSLYMMIGSIGILLYYINFSDRKNENIMKITIILTACFIAIIYLYFTVNMLKDFFLKDKYILLYYSSYLSDGKFLGHVMTRSTGISRILVMISIISLLLVLRYKQNVIRIFGLLFILIINSIIILLASRFASYSYFIILLSIVLLIKISYFKKIILVLCMTIIPYFMQQGIKEYKLYSLMNIKLGDDLIVNYSSHNNVKKSLKESYENYKETYENYKFTKKEYIINTNLIDKETNFLNRGLINRDEKNNSLQVDTSGRIEIWQSIYERVLNKKINIWIGNGFQADRKLLSVGAPYYYGSNVSNALINIFICSGIIGTFIFIYINLKIIIIIFKFLFIEKIYKNFNTNFALIISINIILLLFLRCLVENSISYYNLDMIIYLMCVFIIDNKRKII